MKLEHSSWCNKNTYTFKTECNCHYENTRALLRVASAAKELRELDVAGHRRHGDEWLGAMARLFDIVKEVEHLLEMDK